MNSKCDEICAREKRYVGTLRTNDAKYMNML